MRKMTFPEGCQRQPGSCQSLKAFSQSVCHILCQEAVMADLSEQLALSSAPEPRFRGPLHLPGPSLKSPLVTDEKAPPKGSQALSTCMAA